MIKTKIGNVRSKVEKRQIIQYLTLRKRILHQKIMEPTKGEDIKTLKKRHSEIVKLFALIKNDTIDKEIRQMHQYIHRQNDYLKSLKNDVIPKLPEEVIKGLSSALEDVKNRDYTVITNYVKLESSEVKK